MRLRLAAIAVGLVLAASAGLLLARSEVFPRPDECDTYTQTDLKDGAVNETCDFEGQP